VGEEPNRTAGEKAWSSINHSILSDGKSSAKSYIAHQTLDTIRGVSEQHFSTTFSKLILTSWDSVHDGEKLTKKKNTSRCQVP
jgi:hypothetical protein